MENKSKYTKIIVGIVLAFVLIAFIYSITTPDKPSKNVLKILDVTKTDSVASDKQEFVVLHLHVKNTSSKTIENFSVMVEVTTPDGDSLNYLIFHADPIMPKSEKVCYQPLEVNIVHPIERRIFDTPGDSLKFRAVVTELKLR